MSEIASHRSEVSQASPGCPSEYSGVTLMTLKQWWNDIDRGKP